MIDPKALEAARRLLARTGGHSSEEFGYHTPNSDATVVARALLAGAGNNATAAAVPFDPMEAARIVERVMTEWGKQDSFRDMLDEITAELLRADAPSEGKPDCGCNPYAEETCPVTTCPRLAGNLIEQDERLVRWDQRRKEGQ